jgi:ABC-type glutathione transport system ATPase component
VDQASLELVPGKTFGIVGESGSGKSTLARMMLGLLTPTAGSVEYESRDMRSFGRDDWKRFRRSVQPIFQDPRSALNSRHNVLTLVSEPLYNYGERTKAARRSHVGELLERVHLPVSLIDRQPSELSGGQLQRVAIARALALKPSYLICDEPLSALDVSVQAGVVNLLLELQDSHALAMLFISHDLDVVRHLSDEMGVMWQGRVVDRGPASDFGREASHPYTRQLLGLGATADTLPDLAESNDVNTPKPVQPEGREQALSFE